MAVMIRSLLYVGLLTGWLVGTFAVLELGLRLFTGQLRIRRPRRRRPPEPVEPARRPIQDVAADLRRLSRQLALVPARTPQARRLGIEAAYDDVLVEAARQLEIPEALREARPGRPRDAERRRVEIALAAAGLRGMF
jgi:hypothetical protein